jgi:hypothetical protein
VFGVSAPPPLHLRTPHDLLYLLYGDIDVMLVMHVVNGSLEDDGLMRADRKGCSVLSDK